ncbi:endonuclease/exonuclease/phosphatase [Nocardioides sp. S5]|uniref:ExeM/NucH family extracellular endonuclease n=1 Tax=Nocardioides sp. S5 TaxID=2017486 RepID=UPI001A8DD34D|nr:ExeM/NucH family extracellular endonuclease [Nocardioides sp. S5]QSR30897.1 endonuclease/exonuclease/phosphatase [Nocardioides sp. S5]
MRTPALPSPRRIAVGAGLALLAAGLTPIAAGPVNANTAGPGLVISEVYGAGGFAASGDLPTSSFTHDYIELYNPTSAPVDLSTWAVFYGSATRASGANVSNRMNLTGTIPARGHYLIRGSGNAANGAALPTPDVTSSLSLSGSSGLVILSDQQATLAPATGDIKGATGVVDAVGYGTANTFETANQGTTTSGTTAATRTATGADTDDNSADFTVAAPDPENTSDVDGGDPEPTALEATSPGAQSGQVGQALTEFTLQATGGTSPYTWTATGLPAGVTVATDGAVSGTPTESGTFDVTATATDSATPTPATDDVVFTLTVAPEAALIPIADIQGTGPATPLDRDNVKAQGVVTASYPTGGLNGFYIQTPGADTPEASDAIFVYGGTSGFADYPAVGDSVAVTGVAGEFNGQTQINAGAGSVTPVADLGDVTSKSTIPGTRCELPGAACDTVADLAPAREAMEGELLEPTADFTVTDVYDGSPFWAGNSSSSGMFGEIGLAAGTDEPLVTPTELYDAQTEKALIAQRTAYNNAHRIILDDGSSLNYSSAANTGQPFPWLTAEHSVRVGAAVTFPEPVVFTEGFNAWRLLPTTRVVGEPSATQPQVEQTRADNLAPEEVGGDVKLATFNVLNFFPTTGEEFVASGLGTCSYFRDREGNNITNNRCNPDGPRGAANEANLERQRDKIVAAINTVDADVVSLEELENSAKFGKDRDFAINELVAALNADAGAGTWAAVPSPATLPPLGEQDVIRNGFIYRPADVRLVGDSVVLSDQSSEGEAFEDAREPLAQAFKQVRTPDRRAFAVVVNHFKSKGSGTPDPDGQGNANDVRILQAEALATFADEFKATRGISRVFLAGDFNAYSEEDPIQVLEEAGYTSLESTSDPDEESYNFDGMVGSLDHVLANEAALADVVGVDIWDINASESVYYEYARFNSNITNLYADGPFRSSDHNPEVVGIETRPGRHLGFGRN